MKKSTKNLLFLTSAVIAGMHIYNRVVDSNAERKNSLKVDNGHYYKWKEGNIFYTKTGTGEPMLLIHDTDSGASGEEWPKLAAIPLPATYLPRTANLQGERKPHHVPGKQN